MVDTIKKQVNSESVARLVGIAVGVLTIAGYLGYALAYLREWAFCREFGIPSEFISISWATVLSVSALLLGLLALCWGPTIGVNGWLRSHMAGKYKMRALLRTILAVVPVCAALLVVYPWLRHTWIEWLIGVVFLGVTFFVQIFLIEKGGGSMKRTSGIALVVLILVALLAGAYSDGAERAREQTDYWVPSTQPQCVVLRIYGETLICAPFDGASHLVERDFFIIKMDDQPRPVLTLRSVGPFRTTSELP